MQFRLLSERKNHSRFTNSDNGEPSGAVTTLKEARSKQSRYASRRVVENSTLTRTRKPPPQPDRARVPKKRVGPDLAPALAEAQALLRAEEMRHAEELFKFAFSISHDLREPLSILSSFSELLKRQYDGKLDDEGRLFLQHILGAAERMDYFLRDLLQYAQQFRPLDKPPSTVDSEAALEGVLLTMEKQIQAGRAQVKHGPLPAVQSDFDSLGVVFRHLISNALVFHGTEPVRIEITAEEGDHATTFIVQDNGIGIDPRYREQVFEPFQRLQGKQYPGSGLGLAVCKRIVERHGGQIWVESRTGPGALLRFKLPS